MSLDLPIKIYINARFLTQKDIQGVQRYAIQLLKALDSLIDCEEIDSSQFSFILLSPQNIQHNLALKYIPLQTVGFLKGHLWEQLELPFFTRHGLLLNLTGSAPLSKPNQIVTIHDVSILAVPDAYSLTFKLWYKILLFNLKNIVKTFITVSYFSQKEINKYLGINKEKINVVYEGKEHIFSVEPDRSFLSRRNLLDKRFIFVVSSMSPHKNFSAVVRALEELIDLDLYVVIVGINYPKVFMPPKLSSSDTVIHLGYVNNSELRTLYENAFCFIHPSLYEGFGLPPLEAMACACPVIASNAASLPEICGDAALYCDPYNHLDIASKIKHLTEDEELRQDLIQKGKIRSQLFTWKKCAMATYEIIKKSL